MSKKDVQSFIHEVESLWPGLKFQDDVVIEKVVDKKAGIEEMFVVNGIPAFIRLSGKLVPLLTFLLKHGAEWLPRVVVDEGAVKPIARGANLMRPGIVEFIGEFKKGDIIAVLEPSRRLPIAVHEAVVSFEEAKSMERGVVSKRLHYVGDKFWKYARSLR